MPLQVSLSPSPPRGPHWVKKKCDGFRNPWPSWRTNDIFTTAKMTPIGRTELSPPVIKPTWGVDFRRDAIKATWLGHACFLVELLNHGGRITMCGPKRVTTRPCSVHDIPDVDAIVISHNHYDHLDTTTIEALYGHSRSPHIFAPLGNSHHFERLGIPASHVHSLDWWKSSVVRGVVSISDFIAKGRQLFPSIRGDGFEFELTCTPTQHMSGCSVLDRYKSLWSTVFFAGDTAYQDEDSLPTCPAFREIEERFKDIDLALLLIDAYEPRWFMSTVHCAPQDSLCIFKDIKAKRTFGIHWGPLIEYFVRTWILTMEELSKPPNRLKEMCHKM
ncbi:beta-lactamase superfamily domain-containing protein [Mucidula mucida]|nr:beta-lactamase superfamily domain-containing protein [Mucidula mucida]